MNKTIIPTLALLATSLAALAQQTFHEIDVHGGGGISTLSYKLHYGSQTPGYGGAVGLGYTYFFSNNFGLGLGLDMALYSASASLADRSLTFDTHDMDGAPITITSTIRSYTETQQLTYFHVPLHLQFQCGGKHKFYAQLNLASKLGIPFSATYSTSNVVIHNNGQYPGGYASFGDNIEVARADGIGTFTDKNISNGKLELDITYTLAAELGAKWQLADSWSLYTGVYADYSVTDIRKNERSNFILPADGRMTDQFSTSSVLATQGFVDKAQLMAAGLKVRVAFGAGKRHGTVEPVAPLVVVDSAAIAAKADSAKLATATIIEGSEMAGMRRMLSAIGQLQTTISGFESEQVDMPVSAQNWLDLTAQVMLEYPALNILIEGHSTNLGSSTKSLNISRRRAETAKTYIVSKYGISESRIYTRGRGATEPIVPDKSAKNKQKNGRLEIYVSNKK